MTEEQQFKTKALSAGMEALKAEYRNRMDRETDSYHQAVFQLLLNVDETWRAKNEKSFFETELDKVDNGWGKIVVGNIKGEVFLAPADNITDHVVVKPVERWKPEMGEKCWYISHNGQIDFFRWDNDIFYTAWYDFGNVFRTEQDAIAAQERIKKAFLG